MKTQAEISQNKRYGILTIAMLLIFLNSPWVTAQRDSLQTIKYLFAYSEIETNTYAHDYFIEEMNNAYKVKNYSWILQTANYYQKANPLVYYSYTCFAWSGLNRNDDSVLLFVKRWMSLDTESIYAKLHYIELKVKDAFIKSNNRIYYSSFVINPIQAYLDDTLSKIQSREALIIVAYYKQKFRSDLRTTISLYNKALLIPIVHPFDLKNDHTQPFYIKESDAFIWNCLANVYINMGKADSALYYLNLAALHEPDFDIFMQRGNFYMNIKKYDLAETDFIKASKLSAFSSQPYLRLAHIKMLQKDRELMCRYVNVARDMGEKQIPQILGSACRVKSQVTNYENSKTKNTSNKPLNNEIY